MALFAVAAIIVLGVVFSWLYVRIPPEITVPDVVGLPLTEGAVIMKNSQLSIETIQEFGPDTMAGRILRTSPTPHSNVKPGRNVILYYTEGEAVVEVPDLIGTPFVNAVNTLRRVGMENDGPFGLVVGTMESRESDSPAGTIISQSPAPGTKVKVQSKVDVLVAAVGTTMPSLVNMTFFEASEKLAEMGYGIGNVERFFDSRVPPDIIMTQNPPAGAKLEPETIISVQISTSPRESFGPSYPAPGGNAYPQPEPVPAPGGTAPDIRTAPGPTNGSPSSPSSSSGSASRGPAPSEGVPTISADTRLLTSP